MPRMLDQDERDRAVVAAAWRVIETEGVAALSVRRVAAEAGIAPSSLRYLFPTQASVRARAITAAGERIRARIESLPTDVHARAWARAALLELLPLDDERRTEMSVTIALGVAVKADPALQPLRRTLDGECRAVCARAAAAIGLTDSRDVDALHAMIDGLALHLIVQEPDEQTAWATAALDHWLP
ncbi:TetR/AcrR family transcriptional regulator [Microbacterium halotolerans]|uniref:TetR/AcrR family transcriptional regulator n=1 Tax=Microbacterium halotolerans TaxID=246613 RepID=UPI0013C2ED49|nr:TetR family transcriptional regulator C-terminal domain-containing protein [Microbacterium halotolerans]